MPPESAYKSADELTTVLAYDGDCGICTEWVDYWKHVTGSKVSYLPYQQLYEEHPQVPLDDFKNAVKLIQQGQIVASGAEAVFFLYRDHPLLRLLGWLYLYLPLFSAACEIFYNFFSRHRKFLAVVTYLFWGKNPEPETHTVSGLLFLRLLACVYLSAFVSLSVQVIGLVGSEGLLPLPHFLEQVHNYYGFSAYWKMPGLFWFWNSDSALLTACYAGALLSMLVILSPARPLLLALLYLLYLSLFYAGQSFMTFQWDLLLLESGFLAIFIPSGSRLVIWLYRWLIFRFMLVGGLVKIISQDPNWDNLTALFYHFETQPLPSPLAWYAHHLPESLLMTGVIFTFIVELVLPFFVFTPRRLRQAAAWAFILFQSLIMITGNYNFFNLLTICLCLFLFDDRSIRPLLSLLKQRGSLPEKNYFSQVYKGCLYFFAVLILVSSSEQLAGNIFQKKSMATGISQLIAPWRFVQNYGPFAVMTTIRREVVIEGSNDGLNWMEYHFPYKPGAIHKAPKWLIPHQPRLDWQMWFAALSPPEQNPWMGVLLFRILTASPSVLELFSVNPFPDAAPAQVRARFYEYHFSKPSEKSATGNWWTRTYIMDYLPARALTVTPSD